MSRLISRSRPEYVEPIDSSGVSTASRASGGTLTTEILTEQRENEVLSFLRQNPIDNAIMLGLIKDNGINHHLNRGTFFGCSGATGQLSGVALIGHVTLFDARNDSALAALASVARNTPSVFSVIGEQGWVEQFWRSFQNGDDRRYLRESELMLELRLPCVVAGGLNKVRLATTDDLDMVIRAHARMTTDEIGVDPLAVDPVGFRQRCQRRIQLQRVWVCVDGDRLIFKADVISDIPEAVYLEGIYVDPQQRGKGVGYRCLSILSHTLLSRMMPGAAIAVLVNEQHYHAQAFYAKMGFKLRARYQRFTLQS